MGLTRIEHIAQSAQIRMQDHLQIMGYAGKFKMLEFAPSDISSDPLQMTSIVSSVPNMDPAKDMEIGGPLVSKRRVLLFDVLGVSERLGLNIASQIVECFESGEPLTVTDFSDGTNLVTLDVLQIVNVDMSRIYFTTPKPWQEHWHTVTVAIDDEYNRPVS